MLKFIAPDVWVFDAEWCPDAATGRRVYGIGETATDADVRAIMYAEGGATAENPRPYLKTVLCRVVSIAAVKRSVRRGAVSLELVSLPATGAGALDEGALLQAFLSSAGKVRPQLVGFNSASADLPAIMPRALVHRITAPQFCEHPNKPWEGTDYFAKYSDAHIDLKDLVACNGYGKSTPSLHELAAACGIPGKVGGTGADVVDLWTAGRITELVQYNQRDALTTYLVWLRIAHLSGKLMTAQFEAEETLLEEYLLSKANTGGAEHLRAFLDEWRGEPLDGNLQGGAGVKN